MTAKEQLSEYVARLSEEDARSLWQRIQCDELLPLTADQSESIRRGLADVLHGKVMDLDEVERELGIA